MSTGVQGTKDSMVLQAQKPDQAPKPPRGGKSDKQWLQKAIEHYKVEKKNKKLKKLSSLADLA